MIFEILLIVLLTVANGVLSMSELAVVSSRPARLASMAEKGDSGAQVALGGGLSCAPCMRPAPITSTASARARSHWGIVAAPRPKAVPKLGTELLCQTLAWFSTCTIPRPPENSFLMR
mgnify:CR=1 FL=1